MKHLPNLLTLANLFCGCIAIAYILTAQPYVYMSVGEHGDLPAWHWVYGKEQLYYGSIFIGIAAVCDMLDGFAARALNVHSPIGKDLDSLADIVSFGVAPSFILFKFLWDAQMGEKNAFDVSMLSMAPAFLLACFGALRLAKFNITAATQKSYFIGMPIPAVGIFVASFPIILWSTSGNIAHYIAVTLQNKWAIYLIIGLLCWFMVSGIKFFKMIPPKRTIAAAWPQLTLVLLSLASIPFLGVAAITFGFILYILLSMVYKFPEPTATTDL